MHITGIWLQSFRNYQNQVVQFSPGVTVIVGQNGAGKTTILEGLALASTCDSFRAGKVEEMISFDGEYARVQVKMNGEGGDGRESTQVDADLLSEISDQDSSTIEIIVSTGLVQGKQTQKRVFSVNGVRRRRKDVVGIFKVVVFRPEDLRLIEGSPSRRRNYLDGPLGLLDWKYVHALQTYDKALRQRNKVLEQIREGKTSPYSLAYWDDTLLTHGKKIQTDRAKYIASFSLVDFPRNFEIEYVPSLITRERLDQYQDRSIAAGHTLIGPHKDDFRVDLDGRDVSAYGSRGQQRLAVLWLKMGERAFLANLADSTNDEHAGVQKNIQQPLEQPLQHSLQQPLLLLDDIFSELDPLAHELVFSLMNQGQTIVTSADERVVKEITTAYTKASTIFL